jgi:CRISPR-associated protein Cas2
LIRHLFLVGYDIRCNRNRRLALKTLKGNAIGGQKSMYECWLTQAELQHLIAALAKRIDPSADRVIFLRLDPRATVHTLGVGIAPADGEFFYQG